MHTVNRPSPAICFHLWLGLLGLLGSGLPAIAALHRVPQDYPTIQQAVDVCAEADTVSVAPGTYYENVVLNLAIALLGSGREHTIIDGGGYENCITVSSDGGGWGVVSGFTVQSSGPDTSGGSGVRITQGANPWRVSDCLIQDTRSIGLFCSREVLITRNIFVNTAFAEPGYPFAVMISSAGFATVTHNDFVGNPIGVYAHPSYDSAVVINNVLTGNQVAVSLPGTSYLVRYNCTFQNGVDYSGAQPGEGAVQGDPLFVGGSPFRYELTSGSPCIDSGDPSFPNDDDGTRADIGALPYVVPNSLLPPNSSLPRAAGLLANYPNPFNAGTRIVFELSRPAVVSLRVFDPTGRLVSTLAAGEFAAGEHAVNFDGGGLGSGVYFYTLQHGGDTWSRKMLLLK